MVTCPSKSPLVAISAGFSLFLASCAGCGIDSDSIATLQRVSLQADQAKQALDTKITSSESSDQTLSDFEPPFPTRVDPFQLDGASESMPTDQSFTTGEVEVMGFAKVGTQQAILRVAGNTRFVVVGDRVGTIEIVAITPPRVRLKDNDFVWDISMFQTRTRSKDSVK